MRITLSNCILASSKPVDWYQGDVVQRQYKLLNAGEEQVTQKWLMNADFSDGGQSCLVLTRLRSPKECKYNVQDYGKTLVKTAGRVLLSVLGETVEIVRKGVLITMQIHAPSSFGPNI